MSDDHLRDDDQAHVEWDTTELGRQGGQTYSADYDPAARTVLIRTADGEETIPILEGAGTWQQQAERELAARGYGARWTRWETTAGGGFTMSTARRDTDTRPAPVSSPGPDVPQRVWVPDTDAATWSSRDLEEPPVGDDGTPQTGRVRVYPAYRFPVHQPTEGGVGLEQEITVTDWRKQGREWAEAEARRQVGEALGEAAGPDASWWLGRPAKDSYRWHPWKGTPRDALPVDPAAEPRWRPEPVAVEPPVAPPPVMGPQLYPPGDGDPQLFTRCGRCGFVTGPTKMTPSSCANCRGGDDELYDSNAGEQALSQQRPQPWRNPKTAAELEEQLPPAEQARRFAERLEHHRAWRGGGEEPAAGYDDHRHQCEICREVERGGDGTGRRLRVLPGPGPVAVTYSGGLPGQTLHPAAEAVEDAARTHLGAYTIPDDLTGVLDVDALLGSLSQLMEGIGGSFTALAEHGFGDGPVHASVVELLIAFAGSFTAMAETATEVHAEWASNPDNDHDLRRARGEIPRASLFNVGGVPA